MAEAAFSVARRGRCEEGQALPLGDSSLIPPPACAVPTAAWEVGGWSTLSAGDGKECSVTKGHGPGTRMAFFLPFPESGHPGVKRHLTSF